MKLIRLAVSSLMIFAALMVAPGAIASAEHSGSLSSAQPTWLWQGGPGSAIVPVQDPAHQCGLPGHYCDDALINLTESGTLDVWVDATSVSSDIDLYIYSSDENGNIGEQITSAATGSGDEHAATGALDAGYYVARTAYFSADNDTYAGKAQLTPGPPPPPAPAFDESAPMAAPDKQGPKVPAATAPVAVVTPLENIEFSCAQGGTRSATFDVPAVSFDRVLLVFSIDQDGDPWDRLAAVAINGVEMLRVTTPRTDFSVTKDITEFASLLQPGQTATASIDSGSYVGRMLETVRIEFYSGELTSAVSRSKADGVVSSLLWRGLGGNLSSASANTDFGASAPASSDVEITLSGHGQNGEFWWQSGQPPIAFHIFVDGKEIAVAKSMPYIYALLGFGNANANTACAGPGTSSTGDLAHPLMWWTAQRALQEAGVHLGVGEIPPYRASIRAEDLALLSGGRTVTVVQEGGGTGGQNWPTSVSFLLHRS